MADTHTGPVGFGSDGVHYALTKDGHLDMDRPLTWNPDLNAYQPRQADDPSHFDAFHQDHVDLIPEGAEPIRVTPDEAAKVQALLDQIRSEK